MQHYIPVEKISNDLSNSLISGLVNKEHDHLMVFYDFDFLETKIDELKKAFPENTIHTSAIKANPLVRVLENVRDFGLGVEVASEGELFLAHKTGFKATKIVFDSPAKTQAEIDNALQNGYFINADSFSELERIHQYLKKNHTESRIGVRINPQVGTGSIESTSVAGAYSKFGIPINIFRQEIIHLFKKYNCLCGLHIHIGSQGCEMKMLLDGFENILRLVVDINNETDANKIQFIDIGGGLPISYHHQKEPPDILKYGKNIQQLLKKYHLENIQLITEFGRYLHANSGYIISKVEYVKHYKDSNTLMIHGGADILLRECLNPDNWYHEISLLDSTGKIKNHSEKLHYHIAGPLCFAGDIVARNILLPKAAPGDYIVIHDSGGYTFGMWSRYVSRLFPKIIGIKNNNYQIIRKKETPEDIYKFWSDI